MSKKSGPVVHLFSRAELRQLIKRHGLINYRFDTSLYSLDYDGVEYLFRIQNGQLFLEKILILSDVILGKVEIHGDEIYENWIPVRFW